MARNDPDPSEEASLSTRKEKMPHSINSLLRRNSLCVGTSSCEWIQKIAVVTFGLLKRHFPAAVSYPSAGLAQLRAGSEHRWRHAPRGLNPKVFQRWIHSRNPWVTIRTGLDIFVELRQERNKRR